MAYLQDQYLFAGRRELAEQYMPHNPQIYPQPLQEPQHHLQVQHVDFYDGRQHAEFADFGQHAQLQDEYEDGVEILTKPRLTKEQVEVLEAQFQTHPKPNSNTKRQLALQTKLSLPRVAVSIVDHCNSSLALILFAELVSESKGEGQATKETGGICGDYTIGELQR